MQVLHESANSYIVHAWTKTKQRVYIHIHLDMNIPLINLLYHKLIYNWIKKIVLNNNLLLPLSLSYGIGKGLCTACIVYYNK